MSVDFTSDEWRAAVAEEAGRIMRLPKCPECHLRTVHTPECSRYTGNNLTLQAARRRRQMIEEMERGQLPG